MSTLTPEERAAKTCLHILSPPLTEEEVEEILTQEFRAAVEEAEKRMREPMDKAVCKHGHSRVCLVVEQTIGTPESESDVGDVYCSVCRELEQARKDERERCARAACDLCANMGIKYDASLGCHVSKDRTVGAVAPCKAQAIHNLDKEGQ